ncbi:hypothetical protein VPH35_034400 [Triticum aestivum]|uniref:Cysteine proteinase n=1 Tax=Triticum aestivum TaxID=4565 RepID=A0A3B6D637_WHEAT|nr:zingipain-2-like [Triticum aestivum]
MAPIHSKQTLLALALALAFVSVVAARGEALPAARHERWMAKYGRVYADAAEKLRRREVFAANARHIDAVNRAGNRTYTLGLNQFSDLTNEEFAETHLGYRHQPGGLAPAAAVNVSMAQLQSTLPDSVGWRARGAVTPVKYQGHCASCWAFAAVAATEGLVQIATGNLIPMLEQQVLDCTGGANSCKSGHVNAALTYITASGGLQTEAAYAYGAKQGACRSGGLGPNPAASVGVHRSVTLHGDEGALQALVASQPVAVAVEADADFHHYRSGVYVGSPSCGRNLHHAVTVVGYGADGGAGGQEYWVVKNQWGAGWGEGGYMRLTRGNGNNCGMATHAYYPTMDTS